MMRAKSSSVISCRLIKYLNFSIKNFHLTHCIRLRRLPAGKQTSVSSRNSPHVQTVVSELCAPGNVAVNKNFYGVESDEGVIFVEQNCVKNSPNHSQKFYINQPKQKDDPLEKVKKATFGNVRWDGENKPMIHGQYENKSVTEIDYLSRKFKNVVRRYAVAQPVENSSANSPESEQFSSNSLDMKSHAIAASNKNDLNNCGQHFVHSIPSDTYKDNVDEIHIRDQEIESKTTSQLADINNINNSNFIEDFYFQQKELNSFESNINSRNTLDSSQNTIFTPVIEESITYNHIAKNSNAASDSERNLIENFQNNSTENNNDHTINKNLSVCLKRKNSSFIDESYFGDKLSIDSNTVDKNPVDEQNISFIDESYFGEKLSHFNDNNIRISNKEVNLSKNIMNENATFPKITENNFPAVHPNEETAFECETFYEDLQSGDANLDESKVKNINYIAGNKLYDQPKGVNKPDQQIESSDVKSNPEINSSHYKLANDKQLNATANLFDQEMNALMNEKSQIVQSNNRLKVKSNLKKLVETNPTDKFVQNEAKVNKTALIEHNHLDKSTVQQSVHEKNDETDIKTAYDFVSKLRTEKRHGQPKIKGGKILPGEEKLDSKGFRILTNQVPNLQYFTREEILTILKNNILYADDDLVVLNKPYNMVMHESKTTDDSCLSQYLDELAIELDTKNENPKLFTVHRLDKETCGCLLLARNEMSADNLKSLFLQRKIIKKYWIVTIYVPEPEEGVIDIPITEGSIGGKVRMVLNPKIPEKTPYKSHAKYGKRAVTHYKVISTAGNAALVEVQPETGIKHQIRVHFGFGLSCPILGDHKYSHLTKLTPQKLPSDMLQRLHVRQSKVRHIPMHIYARSILIPQYKEGRDLYVMAPMPTHMSINLQRLKFKKNQKMRV